MSINDVRRLRLLRGNTAAASTFTGLDGELVVDTGLKTIRVQDGATAGGTILATNAQIANLQSQIGNLIVGNVTYDANVRLVGDVTGTGTTGISSNVTTVLANSGVVAGTYGNSTAIPVITVDAKGRITSANTVAPSPAAIQSVIASYLPTYTGNISANTITSGNIIPGANVTYNLGSSTRRWKELWISGNTINIGDSAISATPTGITSTTGFNLGDSTAGNITADSVTANGLEVPGILFVDNDYNTGNTVSILNSATYLVYESTGMPFVPHSNNAEKIGDEGVRWGEIYGNLVYANTVVSNEWTGNLVPSANVAYDLGAPDRQWRDIFVSNGSVYIGDIKLSNDNGTLLVQQVTDAGLVSEAPVPDSPGVVTTDRLVNGNNTLALTANGTVELNGNLFTGGADTGNIVFEADILTNPTNETITIETFNGNNPSAKIEATDYGAVGMKAYSNDSQYFSSGEWVTALWYRGEGGYITFTFNPGSNLFEFLNQQINSFENITFTFNGTETPVTYNGWSGNSNSITLWTGEFMPAEEDSPATINWIEFAFDRKSQVLIDYDDGSFIIESSNLNLQLESNNDINLYAGDDVRISGNDTFELRNTGTNDPINIITKYGSGDSKTWSFRGDGNLQLPAGGDILKSNDQPLLGRLKFDTGTVATQGENNPSGWGGYNLYLDPGGESNAYISIPSVSAQSNGQELVIWNTGAAGSNVRLLARSAVQVTVNGGGGGDKTFEFDNNGRMRLPAGGDIVDSSGQSVLGGNTGDFTFDGTTFSHPENEHYIEFDSGVPGDLLIAAGPGKEININSGNAVNVVVGNTDHWAMITRSQQNNSGDGVEAAAVIYDSSNNVIMLHSKDVDGDDQIVISKFTSAGSLVWQKQISNQMDPDQSHDLAVDEDDDVYVAISNETGPFDDILIFKLDGSNGSEIWKKQYTPSVPVPVVEGDFTLANTTVGTGTYNGNPVQSVTIQQDWSELAGYTFRSSATGSAPFTNYGTIVNASYNSGSNETTFLFANGTFGGGLLDNGLYYSATGLAPNSWKELGSMVVSDGDIFVAGRYQENSGNNFTQGFIFKASAVDGSLDWYQKFDFADNTEGYGMEIGADGDPVVVGVSTADRPNAAWVTKFNGLTGDVLWSNYIFNSDEGNNFVEYTGADVTVDSQNNIYAAINARQNIVHEDNNNRNATIAYVVKLNSTGTIQWTRRIGPGPCGSVATGIDHDSEGNVYLAALTTAQKNPVRDVSESEFSQDINQNVLAIAKYNTSGAVLWQRYVKSSHYDFLASRDEGTGEANWNANNNRGRALSVSTDGKLAVQVTVKKRDPDGSAWDTRYYESITFQIAQDGRTLTLGSGDELFTVEESRIPGKFVTVPGTLNTVDPVNLNENIAEDVVVVTPEFTLVEGILAQQLSTSASYEYTFGNDGTLTIPNDGDVRLTQTQIGWFSIFGPTNNNDDHIDIRASCVDPATGDVYAVGESDDSGQGFLVRYNSQGQILWSIRFEDLDDNDNNRANAVKIHPTNGNIVVLLEFYSGNTSVVLVQVDPDTARVVSSASIRDINNNDDAIAYDFDFMSNGNLVTAGRKYDEWKSYPVTPLVGSTTGVLLVNSVPTGFDQGSWRMSGTGFSGRQQVALDSYVGISGTTRQGSGAQFTISNNGNGTYSISAITNGGTNYLAGHKIKILGTALGGSTPTNDATITVTGVNSGVISSATVSGTAFGSSNTYTAGSAYGTATLNSGSGTFTVSPIQSGTLAMDVASSTGKTISIVVDGGEPFTATITSSTFTGDGGADGQFNFTPVYSGAPGSVTSFTVSSGGGTYTGVSGTNYNVGSGFTLDINFTQGSEQYSEMTNLNGATAGSNYVAGDVITIPGTTFYGTSPTNDMVITVTAVSDGGISTWNYSGTRPSKRVITTQDPIEFGNAGSWFFAQPLGGEAFVLVSDAATFDTVWSRVLSAGSENDNNERYLSVAVGADNAVYAAGEMVARNNCAGADLNDIVCAVVSKFNSSGTHQWTKALNDTNNDCYAKGVAVRSNTIVVTHNNTNNASTIITKLDSTGSVKWQRRTYSSDDSSVAIDSNGDIYAAVEANFENSFNDCIKIIKFNTLGEVTWRRFFGTSGFNERFKNGRNLTIDSNHIYVSGYTYAYTNNYRNGFLVKLPKTGDCDGRYGIWATQIESYDVNEVTSTEATGFTPRVGEGEFETVSVDFASNWWDPTNNDYYHTLEEIRDRDGGAIEFADGTRQTSSAQQIPQRKFSNGENHRLVLEDMGKHIFITNSDTDIHIPYNADSQLPIGFTVVIINDSGSTVNIDADGGDITIRKGSDTASYWDLNSYGMATLIKVDTDYWYISGDVEVD